MDVLVVGGDPIETAVRAALGDADIPVETGPAESVEDASFAVVGGPAGSDQFSHANEAAIASETPWIAVEVGGIGGHPVDTLDGAITGFGPAAGCYDCLSTRVSATLEETVERATADRSAARLAGAIAGRECIRLFAGEQPAILGRSIELPYTERRLLPVPGCSCAPSRAHGVDFDDRSLSLEDTVERVEQVIDDRLGLITSIGEVESFPAPYYLATVSDTSVLSDGTASTEAAGVDPDWNAALVKAVGEGLERYCAGVYRTTDLVSGSPDDVARSVDPGRFVRPEEWTDAPDLWIDGITLDTEDSVRLPADQVFFPPPRAVIRPAITTGLGLGSSPVDAIVAGLTEVIERDATMLAWYSSYEPLALDIADEDFETLARRARSEDLNVTPILVTQDVDVPVVSVAVHRDPESWPAFAAGSAASLDPATAAHAALAEALQNWMELRELGPDEAADAPGEIGHYGRFPEPAQEFVSVTQSVPLESIGPATVPTGVDALTAIVDRCRAAGLTPYATRLTTRDVSQVDLSVVRVVVPEAQPLFTGNPYFGERAVSVPQEQGFEPLLERPYHPYP